MISVKVLVARRLHQLPLRRQRADRLDARLLRQHVRRQRRDHEHDVARLLVAAGIERLLDQRGIADLDEIFGAEREVALPAARASSASAPRSPSARRAFRGTDICTRGWCRGTRHNPAAPRGAKSSCGVRCSPLIHSIHAADGVLVKSLDGVFDGIADADDVDHRLDVGAGFPAVRHRAVDGAEAPPESEDVARDSRTGFRWSDRGSGRNPRRSRRCTIRER